MPFNIFMVENPQRIKLSIKPCVLTIKPCGLKDALQYIMAEKPPANQIFYQTVRADKCPSMFVTSLHRRHLPAALEGGQTETPNKKPTSQQWT